MRGYMFKNRWGALFFVCLTAYGAVSLIGGEDDEGALLSAADKLTESRSDFDERAAELSETPPRPILDAGPGEFSSDEDVMVADGDYLIDAAQGENPSPDFDPNTEAGPSPDEGDEYVLVDMG